MTEDIELESYRDRDAWFAIRGFYYQAQRTSLAALELADDEILQLECGEDLSFLLPADDVSGTPIVTRVLEQIKHLTEPITLANRVAREAMVNAAELLRANANKQFRLRFRFTTTARAGYEAEQPPCLRGRKGIEVWQATRADPTRRDLLCLLQLVGSLQRPSGVSMDRWTTALNQVTADAAVFEKFVLGFEWAVGTGNVTDTREAILQAIHAAGLAVSRDAAEVVHDRLIALVFSLLGRPGNRRITRADLRDRLSQSPDSGELRLQAWIREEILKVVAAVDALAERVSSLDSRLSSSVEMIQQRVDVLEARKERVSVSEMSRPAADAWQPNFEPPPAVEAYVARTETVKRLLRQSIPWLALHGSHGTGKTQLALQLATALGGKILWLRLRNCPTSDLLLRVAMALPTRECTTESTSLLVLDDLPDLVGVEHVAEELALRLRLGTEHPVATLSTSNFRLPRTLMESAVAPAVREMKVPAMTESEIGGLLQSMGAPEIQRARVAKLVLVFSEGHATLVAHLSRLVRDRAWRVDASTLESIVGRRHLASLESEVVKKLLGTVEQEGRTLLYRLSLATGSFSIETAEKIGQVAPKIRFPREEVIRLSGPWLQYERSEELSTSPLLVALPNSLPAGEVRACHEVFASALLRGAVDQNRMARGIAHLRSAGQSTGASIILVDGLLHLLHAKATVPHGGLLALWWRESIDDIPGGLALQLRALQVAVGLRYGREVAHLETDLRRRIPDIGPEDAWALVVSTAATFRHIFGPRPELGATLFRAMAPWTLGSTLPDGRRLADLIDVPFDALLGMAALDVKSTAHALRWFECFEALSANESLPWRELEEAGALVCANVYLAEDRREPGEQQWSAAANALERVSRGAQAMGRQYLRAAAEAILLSIRGEHQGNREEGLRAASAVEQSIQEDGAKFVLMESMARQLAIAEDWSGVREVLSRAFGLLGEAKVEASFVVGARILATRAWLNVDQAQVLEHARAAVEVARPQYGPLEFVRVLGDSAIACGRAGDSRTCLRRCDEGLAILLENWAPENERFCTLFAALTEVVKRLIQRTELTSGPQLEELVPGWFREVKERTPQALTPEKRAAAISIMVRAASALGLLDIAARWGERAWEYALDATGDELEYLLLSIPSGLFSLNQTSLETNLAAVTSRVISNYAEEGQGGPLSGRERAATFLWSPVIWRLAHRWSDGDDWVSFAERLESIARTVEPPEGDGYWLGIATALEGVRVKATWRNAGELCRRQAAGENTGVAGNLAVLASLCDDIPPDQAVYLQMVGIGYSMWIFRREHPVDACVFSFLKTYWERRLTTQRFRFSAPNMLQADLSVNAGKQGTAAMAALLRSVAWSLAVKPPPSFTEFLDRRRPQ